MGKRERRKRSPTTPENANDAVKIDAAADEVRRRLETSGATMTVHTSDRWTSFRHWKFWCDGLCVADYWPRTGKLQIHGRGWYDFPDTLNVWERIRSVVFAAPADPLPREFPKVEAPEEVVITDDLIKQGMSTGGGWSRAQLALIGVEWPPKTGWKIRVIGDRISAAAARRFLEMRKPDALTQQTIF
jgi:hypothetical protein